MITKLRNQLDNLNLDCLLITSPDNIFYLTGYRGFSREEKEAVILITKKNNYLLTDKRYLDELNFLKNFKLEEISAANPLPKVLTEISKENRLKTSGFEGNNITVSEYKKIRKAFKSFKPVANQVENLRELKSKQELERIKKACRLTDLGFSFILKNIREKVTEQELAAKLEIFLKEKGADISFKPIIAFGKNSAVPHHLNSQTKLRKGNIILIDIGAEVGGYCSDMTRTVILGSYTTEFEKMYQTVLQSQKKAEEFIRRSGFKIKASDVDKTARDYILNKGFEPIPHSLGHGIGIQVHEKPGLSPKSKDTLKSGMVFTIEPGIYVKGIGGVRIEDMYLLKGRVLEKITHSTSEIISL